MNAQLALIADLDRCTGCWSCAVACKEEHQLSPGLTFIRVIEVGPDGTFPDLSMYYLPLACQQCGWPSCAASCPEDAINRSHDGYITIDREKCTGCGDCVEGCPYGAIVMDPDEEIARKCELCPELLLAGRSPACVAACPAKALAVVDVVEACPTETGRRLEDEEQRPAGRGRNPVVLKPSLGTDPSGRFVLTRQEWRDVF